MSQASSSSWHNLITLVHIFLIAITYFGFFFVALSYLMVYDDYMSFVEHILCAAHVVSCPPNCTFSFTAQWRDPTAVISVDNPSGTPVLLKLNTTQHEVCVTTDQTTRINVTFDRGLNVEVYPIYPLSDAAPRRVYLPSDDNLTVRVTPPAIGGVLQPFLTIVGAVTGLLATLGIIKHVTKTPAVNAIGTTSFTYANKILYPSAAFFIILVSLASMNLILHPIGSFSFVNNIIVTTIILLSSVFLILYMTIESIKSPQISKKQAKFLVVVTVIIVISIIVLYHIFGSSLQWPQLLYANTLFLLFVNPILLIYFKSHLVVASEIKRATKVGFLHLYDLVVLMWVLQWLINPYISIFKLDYTVLGLSFFTLVILLVVTGIGLLIYITLFKFIGSEIFLFSIIPFVFNEELAARVEFCRRTLNWPTKVRVYPEEDDPVEGFVVECNMGKIAVSDGNSTRMFSWGDVQQIELL